MVKGQLVRMVDEGDIDEAVQLTVIHIWNHLSEFTPSLSLPDPFLRWVRSIARWKGISAVRDRAIDNKRYQGFSDLGSSEDFDRRSDDDGNGVELLPPDLRELYRLAKLGYGTEEAASIMGLGYSALRKRIQRFRDSRTARNNKN
jgi:DNA-directed RNA polymerase specialized sigma24 family protein